MAEDEHQEPAGGTAAEAGGEEAPPNEEELRRRIEEGLRQVRVQDVLLESVATIVNLTARRIAKDDERDLEQARVGIEAVRALIELLEPEPREQVRTALSELQVLYAREAGGAPGGEEAGGEQPPAPSPSPAAGPEPSAPEGRRPGGLWVPPGA
jgi:hypothetical protein